MAGLVATPGKTGPSGGGGSSCRPSGGGGSSSGPSGGNSSSSGPSGGKLGRGAPGHGGGSGSSTSPSFPVTGGSPGDAEQQAAPSDAEQMASQNKGSHVWKYFEEPDENCGLATVKNNPRQYPAMGIALLTKQDPIRWVQEEYSTEEREDKECCAYCCFYGHEEESCPGVNGDTDEEGDESEVPLCPASTRKEPEPPLPPVLRSEYPAPLPTTRQKSRWEAYLRVLEISSLELVPCLGGVWALPGQLPPPGGGGGGTAARVHRTEVSIAPASTTRGRRAAPTSKGSMHVHTRAQRRAAPVASDRRRAAPVASDRRRAAPVPSNRGRLPAALAFTARGDYKLLLPPLPEEDYLLLSPPPPEGDYLQLPPPPPEGDYLLLLCI
ncbi:UNVERIFIED_CONTAM: hypothetical protein FKN15_060558 [Acipenser sinensis]